MKKYVGSKWFFAMVGFVLLAVVSCSNDSPKEEKSLQSLTVSANTVDFETEASTKSVTIETNENSWTVLSSDTSWLSVDKKAGGKGTTVLSIWATKNNSVEARTAVLTISSLATTVKITVTQAATVVTIPNQLYPSYNTNPIAADLSGMSSTAVQLAAKMKLGWNIGNTLEAIGGETAWGNPKVSKALIDLVKANGFNSIRIPCSWNQNLSNTEKAEINPAWMNRVKEVIQYCVDNDMYVILNIHWDGGWLENNCTPEKKEANNAKQKAFWEQIATSLRDFDEHLLFASANEPNVENAIQMAVLNSYHQTFIDAVRSTGGKNAYRNLIVQGPSTDIEKTNKLMTTLPIDKVPNRMMAEVHFYPYQFSLMEKDADWGKMFYYWGAGNHSTTDISHNPTWGEEADVDKLFDSMKTQFVNKGIPVVLGEFGAIRRSNLTGDDLALHLKSRAAFLKYVVKSSKAHGIIPFYWDAGFLGLNTMTLFDRSNNTVYDSQALNALIEGNQ